MKVKQFPSGIFIQDKEVIAIELHAIPNCYVRILTYGAIIQNFVVPNKFGDLQDIVLGFDNIEDYLSPSYLQDYPYLGTIVGRYANRIKNASFNLDGRTYGLAKNNGEDTIHGGISGFDKKNWNIINVSESPEPSVTLGYLSVDGEEGYPGNLNIELTFSLSAERLTLSYNAKTDAPTPVNLTHHGYFNLNPQGGTVANHSHYMPASQYLEQDESWCTTGNIIQVNDSQHMCHDFRKPKLIGQHWNPEEGYDQSFVLDKNPGELALASKTYSDLSGITLSIYTTEPIAHFYTAKYLNLKNAKSGIDRGAFEAFCIETQHHPNAVNIPQFPSTILYPGENYQQLTYYQFTTDR
ncbi:MAG: galactose mutarotase [Pedobacter sp.]|nr:MAG: galactose mutarotase [Pedobacter sp.]